MTEAEAIAKVTLDADTNNFPCLTESEVEKIVEDNLFASVWDESTAYTLGDIIQPTVRNGHFYRCIKAGTSGTTEPTWKTALNSQTIDGSITWAEYETDSDGNLYNIRNAIYQAWLLKAAKSAKEFDTTLDDNKLDREQVHQHCLKMANGYSPIF